MTIDLETACVETRTAVSQWVWWLLLVDVLFSIGIVVSWLFLEMRFFEFVVALSMPLSLVFVIGVIAERQIVFAKSAYIESLRMRKARSDAEIQNSKLTETLLKIWEHREDCKDKSVKVTMEVSQTSLSC